MYRILIIFLTIFTFGFLQNVSAKEKVFDNSEHCVAYKAGKTMFYFVDITVVGKGCQVLSELKLSDDGEMVQTIVSLAVKSIDSENGNRDDHVLELLKEESFPNLIFTSEMSNIKNIKGAIEKGKMVLIGKLKVAENEFDVKFPLTWVKSGNGYLVTGALQTSFINLGLKAPKVGPGGMVADVDDGLEILIHLQSEKIKNFDKLLMKE